MARYTGPRARVSRRLGTNIWGTKGENKVLEKRPYPPGEHGRTRRRGNVSEYLLQLQEKQKARFTYGLSERQFRRVYAEANRREGVTGLPKQHEAHLPVPRLLVAAHALQQRRRRDGPGQIGHARRQPAGREVRHHPAGQFL